MVDPIQLVSATCLAGAAHLTATPATPAANCQLPTLSAMCCFPAGPKTLGDVAPISVMKICCTLMCVVALVVLCVALAIQGGLSAAGREGLGSLLSLRGYHLQDQLLLILPVPSEDSVWAGAHLRLAPRRAASAGHLPQVRWLPDPAFFGDGSWERLKNVLATIPVIMTA